MSPTPERPKAKRVQSSIWDVEEARTKFAEVIRRARHSGPQYVSVRGKKAVAIIDAGELERLLPSESAPLPLVEFLESIYIPGLDLERDRDAGRDATL